MYVGTRGLSQEEVLVGEIGKIALVKVVCKYMMRF